MNSGANQKLKLLPVNINGLASKLENNHFLSLINVYDIVCIQETKTVRTVGLPGFKSICSANTDKIGEAV